MTANEKRFNEDELQTPVWLNKEFFEKVLKQSEQTEEIVVKSLKFQPGSAKGDHVASVIFRAFVNYQLRDKVLMKSMIVKTLPEYESKKAELLHESKLFETEIAMYSKVVPKFEKILKAIGEKTQQGVRCIYHALTPKKVIIFEDIVPLGYAVMRDRWPNLEEAKAVFEKIAKWHAVSYKLNLEDPHFFDEFRYGSFMAPNMRDIEPYYEGFSNFLDLLEAHEELKQYKPFFDSCKSSIAHDVVKIFNEARDAPQADGSYGLCHGDLHFKNLMFKTAPKAQNFVDVIILDFQLCYLGPLVNDVLFATYMMLDADMRAKHLDKLYYFYFTKFQETLKKINFKGDIPKMIDFRQQLMRLKQFELLLITISLPMWYAYTDSVMDTEVLFFDKEKRKAVWKNPLYVKEVKELLPKLLHMGYLEKE